MQTARDPAEIIASVLTGVLNPFAAKDRAAAIIAALDEAAAAEAAAVGYRKFDIVQIKPDVPEEEWALALAVVAKVETWGVYGCARNTKGGADILRLRFDQIEPTGGRAAFAAAHYVEAVA